VNRALERTIVKMAKEEIEEKIRQFFLEKIKNDWKNLGEDFQPWGAWIKEYPSISRGITDGIDDATIIPKNVWFLDKSGITRKSIWEYRRMIVVQFFQPWCKRIYREPTIWSTTRKHEIGLASFAQYEQSKDYYFDTMWGGLFGWGWQVTFNDSDEAVSYKQLWVS
jgi:hypothetical protein